MSRGCMKIYDEREAVLKKSAFERRASGRELFRLVLKIKTFWNKFWQFETLLQLKSTRVI